MKLAVFIVANVLTVVVGCSDNSTVYPSAEGKSKPYILKEGCTFSIVKEHSSASVTSPTVTGMAGASAAVSVRVGEISIGVADCKVVENSYALPIYEN